MQKLMTYHGGSTRMMFLYDPKDSPPNLHKWDFIDPINYVCSNATMVGNKKYRCEGHVDGDKFYPTFHGDPDRDHRFWIYPLDKPLGNIKWDYYERPCDNCELQKEGELIEFICKGHHQSYHENGLECSGTEKCRGHALLQEKTTYHGDPSRGYKFWVYPKKQALVTA